VTQAGASPGGSLRLYSYPKCATCRKALTWLSVHQIPVDLMDITVSPPSFEDLQEAWDSLPEPRRLFNTSGLSYRALGAARVKAMAPAEAIAALAADGRLIRRPLLFGPDGLVLTGFDPDRWEQALKPLQSAP
jgi:arsenate reductase